jgi:diaminohydroxyphosphoribosylaminopyrimidine deaminase/5-amino-6-(5-phosphoribosylamino)uracil reductase
MSASQFQFNGESVRVDDSQLEFDEQCMRRALELASRGQGLVEPNPMVGCVISRDRNLLSEGWHRQFGGPHAEVDSLRNLNGESRGCTAYVNLEPCCHTGKTPPCTEAIIAAQLSRVVVAMRDPDPRVAGQGIEQLRAAGIKVETGLLEAEAKKLNAPFMCRNTLGRPWVIAKWAMTWDGRIATRSGDSQWISNEQSREVVHQIRGRVDGIAVGRGTVEADDPELTARPSGARTAARIIFDSAATLPRMSKLLQTLDLGPVWLVVSERANATDVAHMRDAGCDVVSVSGSPAERIHAALREFSVRGATNILVEGGGELLGSFRDAGCIDEVHIFLGPLVIGGQNAKGPVGGTGAEKLLHAQPLEYVKVEMLGEDVYVRGRTKK